MKNQFKTRLILFYTGIVLILFAFLFGYFTPNMRQSSQNTLSGSALPSGTHIPININTATEEELCLLDGIGDSLAERIISYRQSYGEFGSKEDIKKVTGIGDKIYDKIKSYICTE